MEKEMEKENANLAHQPSEAAELIFEIALAAKESTDNSSQIPILKTLKEVINHPIYRPKWKEAVNKELTGLANFSTWRLIKRTPGMLVISNK